MREEKTGAAPTPPQLPTRAELEDLFQEVQFAYDDDRLTWGKSHPGRAAGDARLLAAINAKDDALDAIYGRLRASEAQPAPSPHSVGREKELRGRLDKLAAMHELLADDVVYVSRAGVFVTDDDDKSPIGYRVLCNDVFCPAADAEDISLDDAPALHALIHGRPEGVSPHEIAMLWVSERRSGQQPWRRTFNPAAAAYYARAVAERSEAQNDVPGPEEG